MVGFGYLFIASIIFVMFCRRLPCVYKEKNGSPNYTDRRPPNEDYACKRTLRVSQLISL